MDFKTITIEEMPKTLVSVKTLRDAFESCTPYDCPSRGLFNSCYPERTWAPETPDDIPMEKVVRILIYCTGHTEYLDRFIGFFAGARIASYDVLKEYFVHAFVKT